MNQTLETIRDRYSCRAFTGAPLEEEKLQAIAQAALQAPSGMNAMPWQVVVVQDKALLDEIEAEGLKAIEAMPDKSVIERVRSRGGKIFYNASCIIFVPRETARGADSAIDCGIVCQTISLAAQSLGVGSCICGMANLCFTGEKGPQLKQRLGFAEGYEFGCSVLLGPVAQAKEPHQPEPAKLTFI